ncbi:hypothetical protein DdX_06580 [Ditylenchus destructor]|uniref:Uncharacterized protein n=1 Tax=Ditylenchus destructor TaxID=166010 RepID=A0AAD4NAP5_9BILA|nr:hypothetical protein DdX_06580 [Ditylenchus destructor]
MPIYAAKYPLIFNICLFLENMFLYRLILYLLLLLGGVIIQSRGSVEVKVVHKDDVEDWCVKNQIYRLDECDKMPNLNDTNSVTVVCTFIEKNLWCIYNFVSTCGDDAAREFLKKHVSIRLHDTVKFPVSKNFEPKTNEVCQRAIDFRARGAPKRLILDFNNNSAITEYLPDSTIETTDSKAFAEQLPFLLVSAVAAYVTAIFLTS